MERRIIGGIQENRAAEAELPIGIFVQVFPVILPLHHGIVDQRAVEREPENIILRKRRKLGYLFLNSQGRSILNFR